MSEIDTSEPAESEAIEPLPAPPRRRRRRLDKGLLTASFVIACGVVLIAWGMLSAVTGDDGIDRPDEIEDLRPVENAVQVLQQEAVIVDLEFGYEATLVIDGIEIPTTVLSEIEAEPGEQLALPPTAIFDVATGVLTFQPQEGAPIEEFTDGRHEARVTYWKSVDGPDTASSYRWSFTVV
jgi:hypothetical protein